MGISFNSSFDDLARFVNDCANTACKLGVLAMPGKFEEVDDAFIKYAINLVVDGRDPQEVRSVLDTKTAEMVRAYEHKLKMFCEATCSIQKGEQVSKIVEACEKWRVD